MTPIHLLARGAGTLLAAFALSTSLSAQPTGQWDFNNGNLDATVGAALSYLDGAGGQTSQGTQFGSTATFGIPNIGGQPALVMKFPANTNAALGYSMPTPPAANGGGGFVNDWTLIMDVLFPAESSGKWRGLIETDGRLIAEDDDLFINTSNQLGIGGRYFGSVLPNTWHRIGFVVQADANKLSFYIDGVPVGSRDAGNAAALDGRWALAPAATAELFNDNDGEAAGGYVNSIQLRDVALSADQMRALGGPTAAGIPSTLPAVPSFIQKWIPSGAVASRTTDLGVLINAGDTTIDPASIVLKLNGTPLQNVQIASNGPVFTVSRANPGPFPLSTDQTLELIYRDSLAGLHTNTHAFNVALLFEDFENVPLGPNVDEAPPQPPLVNVWTKTPPAGWTVDDSGVPAFDDPAVGVTEWKGWSFAVKDWWASVAGDQNRTFFTKGTGVVAIADPDEWDDKGSPAANAGYITYIMKSSVVSMTGVAANTAFLQFDSSWRPECCDDANPQGQTTNNQTAIIEVSYNGGAPVQVMKWDSAQGSPTFHPDSENESVTLQLNNPASATNMMLTITLANSGNDWWWAVDNIAVRAGTAPPFVTQAPTNTEVTAGSPVTFTVVAGGGAPFSYQWFKGQGTNRVAIAGATNASYTIAQAADANAGFFSVQISNSAGSIFSPEASLVVLPAVGGVTIFSEDFNGLPLGPNVDETLAGANVWTKTAPAGWTIDDSGVPGAGTDNDGVTEWAGWSFADRVWWSTTAGDQQRTRFTKGTGAIAVADGDEWDDLGREPGTMDTFLKTPSISLQGIKPNSAVLRFDSSWRPEPIQKATLTVSFNGGAAVELFRWESDTGGANFHPDNVNETVTIPLHNPAGATNLTLTWGYIDAGNNWWWGIDNIVITGEKAALFFEDFNSLPLGPKVDEGLAGSNVWTKTPPAGWSIDDSGVPGAGTSNDGVTEWAGWSFADRVWWATTAGDQQRTQFTKGTGAVAVADGDEWDDQPRAAGNQTTFLKTPPIALSGAAADTVVLRFDSSWRAEAPQKTNVRVAYDGGTPVEVLRWESEGPLLHPDNVNETVTLPLHNPAGAQSMVITFGYLDAGNNWWWAIDNLEVTVSGGGSATDLGKLNASVSGSNLILNWTGGAGIKLQKTTSLSAPNWSDVPNTTGASTATEAIGTGMAFYRLIKS